jgi:hypothetical protein
MEAYNQLFNPDVHISGPGNAALSRAEIVSASSERSSDTSISHGSQLNLEMTVTTTKSPHVKTNLHTLAMIPIVASRVCIEAHNKFA